MSLGGDTDTNACIVGGIIGAYVGIGNISQPHLTTLLEFDCVNDGRQRPEFLSVGRHVIDLLNKLIDRRPQTVQIDIKPEAAVLTLDEHGNLL